MPETYEQALARAKKHGFSESSLEKGEKGWYIIPHGLEDDPKLRRGYVECRDSGGKSSTCAAVMQALKKNGQKKAGKE